MLKNVIYRQLPEYEWFEIDVITGVFSSKPSQQIAESLGMETLYDFMYVGWTVKEKETGEDQVFFKEMAPGNYYAKVMSMRVDSNFKQGLRGVAANNS